MEIVRTIADLRTQISPWRNDGQKIALVPTMGALHEGHLSLLRYGKDNADRAIVSIFVNPTQFLPGEDFVRYPRDEKRDAELLRGAGADLLYAPDVPEMYPKGARTTVSVREISRRWEGEARPGHFDGVATIVAKLLLQAMPDFAVFGEKDYQQLQVVRRMARDLDLPVEIIGRPTVRDKFGLALSSRNAYLTHEQVKTARILNRVLFALAIEARAMPARLKEIAELASSHLREEGFTAVDYLTICDAETLEPLTTLGRPARILAAAALGSIRLLDNVPVE